MAGIVGRAGGGEHTAEDGFFAAGAGFGAGIAPARVADGGEALLHAEDFGIELGKGDAVDGGQLLGGDSVELMRHGIDVEAVEIAEHCRLAHIGQSGVQRACRGGLIWRERDEAQGVCKSVLHRIHKYIGRGVHDDEFHQSTRAFERIDHRGERTDDAASVDDVEAVAQVRAQSAGRGDQQGAAEVCRAADEQLVIVVRGHNKLCGEQARAALGVTAVDGERAHGSTRIHGAKVVHIPGDGASAREIAA